MSNKDLFKVVLASAMITVGTRLVLSGVRDLKKVA